VRDAWDVSHPSVQVNRRRVGGAIRLAEEGEVVLADARQSFTLPVVKVKEPKHVLVVTAIVPFHDRRNEATL
jgi:hypothetical protein